MRARATRRERHFPRLLFFFLILPSLSACATSQPFTQRALATPQETYQLLQERSHRMLPYRALFRVSPGFAAGWPAMDVAFKGETSNSFSLSGLSPFGLKIFHLDVTEDAFHLDLPGKGKLSGSLRDFGRIFGGRVPFDVDLLREALTVYGIHSGTQGSFFLTEDAAYYYLYQVEIEDCCKDKEAEQGVLPEPGWAYPVFSWWIDKKGMNLVRKEIYGGLLKSGERPKGDPRSLIIEYSEFRSEGSGEGGENGIPVPHRILVKDGKNKTLVVLSLLEIHFGHEDSGT